MADFIHTEHQFNCLIVTTIMFSRNKLKEENQEEDDKKNMQCTSGCWDKLKKSWYVKRLSAHLPEGNIFHQSNGQ